MIDTFANAFVGSALCATLLQMPIRRPLSKCLSLWHKKSQVKKIADCAFNFINRRKNTNSPSFLEEKNRINPESSSKISLLGSALNIFDIFVMLIIGALTSTFALQLNALIALPLGLVLCAVFILDLRWFWLPDRLTLPLAVVGLFEGWKNAELQTSLLGLLAAAALFLTIRYGYKAVRGVEGLGFGDVKLAAAMGAWLGPIGFLHAVLLASVAGIISAAVISLASGAKLHRQYRLPFGSYLSIGFWILWCVQ